jgi:hypothetical protein
MKMALERGRTSGVIEGGERDMPDDVRKEDVKPTADQRVAARLRQIAQLLDGTKATEGLLNEATTPLAESLLSTLEVLLDPQEDFCSVLVTLSRDNTIADWLCSPGHPPEPLYELMGRLQSIIVRVGGVALHLERQQDGEDHTGHGCEHDPEIKAKNTN